MDNKKFVSFHYTFRFPNQSSKEFHVDLDAQTLALIPGKEIPAPAWTELGIDTCENCPLSHEVTHCPIAVNFAHLIDEFLDRTSFEEVVVEVAAPERTYVKKTTVQKGLSSIIGIYMVTSNCPVMDELRPMVRFHLPFATPIETLYRAVSSYLTAQFFAERDGNRPDWILSNLIEIYKKVSLVNEGISKRLRNASTKDANVNAVIILHSFGEVIPFSIESGLDDIQFLFSDRQKRKE